MLFPSPSNPKVWHPLAAAQSQASPLDSSQCRHLTPSRGPRFSLTQRYRRTPESGIIVGIHLHIAEPQETASYQVLEYDNHLCSYVH
ncbi:hypothetical protein V8C26DRAFT_131485 [Trichoderma gracile]